MGGTPPDLVARQGGRAPDLLLLGLLGEGGMGAVYAARQRALDREVAVKRPREGAATPATVAALLDEARLTGSLEHPGIVPVHALGVDAQGWPALVMKRVEGVVWRDLLDDPAHPAWERLGGGAADRRAFHVEVLMQVCNALHFAHSRGVVHRDVKPENVMIGGFGEVYLLDWGVALSPRAGHADAAAVVGTPVYLAPEMLAAPATADARTDVYLLGATLHEVLTGTFRHPGGTLEAVLASALLSAKVAYGPEVPADLAALCNAATHADPAERPPTAAEFRRRLSDHQRHRGSLALSSVARRKHDEAEPLLAGGAALTSSRVGMLLAETHFGHVQSLREWPENPDALSGLSTSVERLVERELAQRNPDAARALLGELPAEHPALRARVEALEGELRAAREREAFLARQAREMDAGVSVWPRILGMVALLVVGGGLSTAAVVDELRRGQPMPMEDQVAMDVTMVGLLGALLIVARRRLLTNAFNRVTWGVWSIALTANLVVDWYLMSQGFGSYTAAPATFVMIGACFAVAAVTFQRFYAWLAAISFTGAAVIVAWPWLTTGVGTLVLVLVVGLSVDHARRGGRAGRAAPG
ncbi:MAG: protein kinase, partial [Deltaproteobacteria bacterium]|nr:protein kinase [Deltaproteobacteria bacterium]